jgi:hypothetical protein
VSIRAAILVTSLRSRWLDILPIKISLRSISGSSASSTEKVQTIHPAFRIFIVKVVVVPDHLAIGVSKPSHHHPLGNAVVCACGTEEVPETVRSTVHESLFSIRNNDPPSSEVQRWEM